MTPAAEPGYLTTEFWGKLFVQVIGVLILFHVIVFTSDQLQGVLGLGALVVPELFYAISRGLRKLGTAGTVSTSASSTGAAAVGTASPAK